jgi:hypothetical protein
MRIRGTPRLILNLNLSCVLLRSRIPHRKCMLRHSRTPRHAHLRQDLRAVVEATGSIAGKEKSLIPCGEAHGGL